MKFIDGERQKDPRQEATETMKFLIIIKKTNTGYSAYSPDLDGYVSTGETVEEITANMQEAIEFHLEGLRL